MFTVSLRAQVDQLQRRVAELEAQLKLAHTAMAAHTPSAFPQHPPVQYVQQQDQASLYVYNLKLEKQTCKFAVEAVEAHLFDAIYPAAGTKIYLCIFQHVLILEMFYILNISGAQPTAADRAATKSAKSTPESAKSVPESTKSAPESTKSAKSAPESAAAGGAV
jgi:hypothetical protein